MKTYLELEGKLGPKPKQQPQSQQNQPRPTQPSTNPVVRRGTKISDKRRKLIPTGRYKVWVVAKPIQVPTPKASNTTMQTPETIPITVMNLAKGKFQFQENPPQGGSSAGNNPPPLEDIPMRAGTPWPGAGSASENLFESRKDWPIPPGPTSTPTIEVEPQSHEAAIPCATMTLKQIEKCGWGPNCPICKNIEEDWNGDLQNQQHPQQSNPCTQTQAALQPPQKNFQCPQAQNPQQPQNFQCSQSFDIPDCYPEQIHLRKEWEEKMEILNDKYGLDYYSSSESESDWDEEEPKYETLI